MTELLSCPFCGQTPVIGGWKGVEGGCAIECSSDLYDCPINPGVTAYERDDAIAKWNKRPTEPQAAVAFRHLMPIGHGVFAWTRWLEMDELHRAEGNKIEYAYSRAPVQASEARGESVSVEVQCPSCLDVIPLVVQVGGDPPGGIDFTKYEAHTQAGPVE